MDLQRALKGSRLKSGAFVSLDDSALCVWGESESRGCGREGRRKEGCG